MTFTLLPLGQGRRATSFTAALLLAEPSVAKSIFMSDSLLIAQNDVLQSVRRPSFAPYDLRGQPHHSRGEEQIKVFDPVDPGESPLGTAADQQPAPHSLT